MTEDLWAQLGGFRPGAQLAGYQLEAQVGKGGMAVVFRARDKRLDRQVALKILAPWLTADESFRLRFAGESRAAASVEDPHIIPVYEAGEADGVLFIAMRFIPGGDLQQVLDRDGTLSPARAVAFVSPVASALDAAHAVGLVHRDVKPGNVLVDTRPGWPEHVYLSDFGVSKHAMSSSGLTSPGRWVGTTDYVAPEQILGRAVDGRADQYALACLAYQLLTGTVPYIREREMAVVYAHLHEPPPSLTSRQPGLPAAADEVLTKAMAKVPEQRYASCRDFADALQEALGVASHETHGPISASGRRPAEIASPPPGRAPSRAGPRNRAVTRVPRRRIGFIGLAGILIAAAVVVVVALTNDPGQGSAKPLARPALRISPQLVRTLSGRVAGRLDIAYSAEGETLVTANSYGGINLWNLASGQKVTVPLLEPYYDDTDKWEISVAYSPNGQTWAVANANGTVSVWNVATKHITVSLNAPHCGATAGNVSYDSSGTTLVTTCAVSPAKIYLWDVATGQITSVFNAPAGQNIYAMAYSPKGTTFVTADNSNNVFDVTGNTSGKTYLWDVATRQIVATLTDPRSRGANDVAYSPNGKAIATADSNGKIYLWDAAAGREIAALATHCQGIPSVAYSPDGTTLATVCGQGGNNINLWDVATRHIVTTFSDPDTQGVDAIAYSPKGTSLAVADNNGNTYVWTHVSM